MANHFNLPAVQKSLYQADKINPTPVTDESLAAVIGRRGTRLYSDLNAVLFFIIILCF